MIYYDCIKKKGVSTKIPVYFTYIERFLFADAGGDDILMKKEGSP